jgi:phosphate-selective porin OprO and OprP
MQPTFTEALSLIGEWQYGYGGYASAANPASQRVPFSGFYVSTGYFLTGEHVERRRRLKPIRSVFPINKDEKRGIGAWEIAGRVSQLRVGGNVFDSGFADPDLWSNSAMTTEVGLNWYLNEYMKIYMFWLHADFGSPVQYRPDRSQKSADMLWMRCQLYF